MPDLTGVGKQYADYLASPVSRPTTRSTRVPTSWARLWSGLTIATWTCA